MLTDPATGLRPAGRANVSAGRRRLLLAGLLVLVLVIGALLLVQRLRSSPPVPLRPLPAAAPVVDRALRNCVGSPSACGYPDASNTGVPASVALKAVPSQVSSGPGWHWDSRGFVKITGSNTVFSGYSVEATVDVSSASNVLISNNRITVGGDTFGVSLRHTRNVI
ncbi:MAG TPA: hypothetical protein VH298_12175, partial [Jatrophihabitans sp.]|nr:hypothetical protein [Jatrophihabitans sp.]